MDDDLTIPKFLRRPPPTAADLARLEAIAKEVRNPTLVLDRAKGGDWGKPKGMSQQEWEEVKLKRKEKGRMTEEAKEKLKAKKQAGKKPRPSRDGLVSISDIAKELGLIPREARAVLRAIKMVKPEVGWAWKKDDVADVKKKIEDGHKAVTARPKGKGGSKKRIVIPPAGEDTDWALDKKERKHWKRKGKKLSLIEAEKAAVKEAADPVKSTRSKAAQKRAERAK